MHKIAFKMQLKPGCLEEFRRRHDEIWPDLVKALKGAGISDYSIFTIQPRTRYLQRYGVQTITRWMTCQVLS